jgi:hypothetical protein
LLGLRTALDQASLRASAWARLISCTRTEGQANASVCCAHAGPPTRVKVVANLPYNITKDFLRVMLPKGDVVSELSIMIQEEVREDSCAVAALAAPAPPSRHEALELSYAGVTWPPGTRGVSSRSRLMRHGVRAPLWVPAADVIGMRCRVVLLSNRYCVHVLLCMCGTPVQVAQRLVSSSPGKPDYRAMSVYTHFFSRPVVRLMQHGAAPCIVFLQSQTKTQCTCFCVVR